MSNYKVHAMREFRASGWLDENGKYTDDMQEMICNHVLALLDVFAGEGHSGSSARYAIDLFSKLAKFDPIVPTKREPLSDKEITKNTPKLIHIGERLAFHAGVRFAERHHIIGVNDDT